ncbi:MAG: CIA30 family protein [Maribacter sp.]|nr:CIA30 family protein [Maribacter sp.]
MQPLCLLIIALITMQSYTLVDFQQNSNPENWTIVDDVVMGGRSSGSFYISDEGYGVFQGSVSLENNGGFSSLRYRFKKITTKPYSKIVLRVKGDGKTFQFRIKTKASDYYSFISYFDTSGDWETIEISLNEMYPAFRGRTLNIPNFSSGPIEELAFLIGNKKAESFKLEIDTISLK